MRQVEQRVTGQFLKIEGPSGIVVSVAGWMVDALVCADMSIGPPQVNLAALSDINRLVTRAAAPAHSPSENGTAKEEVDEAAQRAHTDLGQADEPDVRTGQDGRDERPGAGGRRHHTCPGSDAGRGPRRGGA